MFNNLNISRKKYLSDVVVVVVVMMVAKIILWQQ